MPLRQQVEFLFCIFNMKTKLIFLASQLEIVFLLDSGASISVLKTPTYMMIAQIFNVSNHDQHDKSKA